MRTAKNQLIHEMFLARAAERPEAIALMWAGNTITTEQSYLVQLQQERKWSRAAETRAGRSQRNRSKT